jgi:phosphohistidine phosphatase SixA
MFTRTLSALLLNLALAAPAAGQDAVFLVRHAERADAASGRSTKMGGDPDLSEAGRARAVSLATVLKDAGITAIYTTELVRTRQTAAPLAKALGLTPTVVSASDTAALVKALEVRKGNVLVVGHSNTVPEIIKGLGVRSPASIGDDEFDNLFVVTAGTTPGLIRLHYR